MNKKAVLFANGETPNAKLIDRNLINNSFIIGIDKGYEIAVNLDLKPDILIGDLDSVNQDTLDKNIKIIENKNQDDNDLEKSLIYCVGNNLKDITIYSCTGKKDDQNLANLLLCYDYSSDLNITIISNFKIINFVSDYREFDSEEHQEISIIAPNKDTLITTTNLKFNLNNQALNSKSQGISNIALGNKFSIKSSDKIILFRGIV